MNKIKEFTDSERQKYSKPYVDFIMHGQELAALHTDEECNKRFFIRKVEVLKKYIDALDEADQKASGEGVFEMFKSDEQYKHAAMKVKSAHNQDIEKLMRCQECKCASCLSECKFNSCHYCQYTSSVKGCDKSRNYVTSGYKPVTLYSNDEERDVYFKVLGILTDHFSNKKYIYLVEQANPNNQHILEYCKYVNGDVDYLPLDEDVLDRIYHIFVQLECYE